MTLRKRAASFLSRWGGQLVRRLEDNTSDSRAAVGSQATWEDSQAYELSFWKNEWPYRHLPRNELVALRARDAGWFLGSMNFTKTATDVYEGFRGRVLEVGCGPIGFFEAVRDVQVTAIDPLMRAYSEQLPYARFGAIGNCTYSNDRIEGVQGLFDYVVCSNVLDHTGDWRRFLTACMQRVSAAGNLLLYTHCRNAPSLGHTQVFGPANVLSHLLDCGVKTISSIKVKPDSSGHADFECYVRCEAAVTTKG